MRELIRWILEAGPLGWIVLASNALASIAALLLAARSVHSRPRRPLRSLGRTLGAACAGLAIAAAITAVLFGRASAIIVPPGRPPLSLSRADMRELRAVADASLQAEASLCLTAHVALGVACLVALASILTRLASRKKIRARRLFAWTASLAGAEIAASIAIGVIRRSRELNVSAHCQADCRRTIAADVAQILADARLHVGIATAVALFLLLRAARRSAAAGHAPLGPRARIFSLALFGIGIPAFAGSRAMAFDATHPIPGQNLDELCPISRIDERSLPPAGAASALSTGAVIELSARGAEIYGQRLERPEDLFQRMASMRSLWRQIQPNRPFETPLIAASEGEPLASLEPWLLALEREGFVFLQILVAHPPDFADTATLGPIERAPRCASLPVSLEQIHRAITRGATWGELAASASAR